MICIRSIIVCPCMCLYCERARSPESLNQRLRNSAVGSCNVDVRLSSTYNRRTRYALASPRYRIVAPHSISRCPSDLLSFPHHRRTHPSDFYYLSFRASSLVRFFRIGVEVTARRRDTVKIEKKKRNEEAGSEKIRFDRPLGYQLDVG